MAARSRRVAALLAVLPTWGALASGAPTGEPDALRSQPALGLETAVAQALRSPEPVWVGYTVAALPRDGASCCWDHDCCDLELDEVTALAAGAEHAGDLLVLLRFADRALDRARFVDAACRPSFGGRRALWAGEVTANESLTLLGAWVDGSSDAGRAPIRRGRELLPAIAYHDGTEATRRLAAWAADSQRPDLAKDAVFWLGTARREEGYASLLALLASRPATEILKAVAFALHQSPVAAAEGTLAELAAGDPLPEVRREALFWLGQSGAAHAETIYAAALADPDEGVARHAVFVLGQLPEPEGVEQLVRVLTQDRRPALRREALFWIAQSDSDQALDIVDRILSE